MTRTVVAIYDGFQRANEAVRELIDNGIPRNNISILANNARGEPGAVRPDVSSVLGKPPVDADNEAAEETGTGAGVGAGIGAAIGGIGGLLVGLGALVIPGIGPVIAAGPLAVALSTLTGAGVGAVAGGVTGGLLGALIGLGIPEEEAEFYSEGVRRGGVLVTVQAEEQQTDQVMDLLNRHQPMDINERVSEWRAEGWTGYDPNAQTVQARPVDVPPPADRSPNIGQQGTQPPIQDPAVTQPAQAHTQWRKSDYSADFSIDSPVYLNHYRMFLADEGNSYDYYVPAYRYGYSIAGDQRYQNHTWDEIEAEARRDWEYEHPGTWERFSSAIRHAWEDVTERHAGY